MNEVIALDSMASQPETPNLRTVEKGVITLGWLACSAAVDMVFAMQITAIPLLHDNYAWLLGPNDAREYVIVDPSESEPIVDQLQAKNGCLAGILLTHHHWDHVGGVPGLLSAYPSVPVFASPLDSQHLDVSTTPVMDGQTLDVLGESVKCLHVPGHTLGAVAWYFPKSGAVFTGDTLFLGGCGRLFEGSPEQMFASLQRLAALPESTQIYCGHEYTEKNLSFAQTVEPNNAAIPMRLTEVRALRAQGKPTVPASMRVEKQTNPFLRAGHAQFVNVPQGTAVEVFATLRALRNEF